jgi:hypothetical protein
MRYRPIVRKYVATARLRAREMLCQLSHHSAQRRRISVRRINGDKLQAIYGAIFAHHWIIDHLNYRMMPKDQMMRMQC